MFEGLQAKVGSGETLPKQDVDVCRVLNDKLAGALSAYWPRHEASDDLHDEMLVLAGYFVEAARGRGQEIAKWPTQ